MDVPCEPYDVPMENFDVVQALVRTSLGGDQAAITRQVERLIQRLAEGGDDKSARSLRSLLTRSAQRQAVEPMSLESSASGDIRHTTKGQRLGVRTALPVDRESGAPLCEVAMPDSISPLPVLPPQAETAYESLLDEWRHEEELLEHDLPVSRTLLIYGPPGTGKTSLARAIATRLGLPAVVARLDGLISSLLGNTARNLGALFDFCNRYECVLILDEFDAVAKVRDDANEVGEIKRVVNALLQNLDKRAQFGLTVAVTNHEQLLDTAVWRRFEHQVHLGLPDASTRFQIALSHVSDTEEPEALASVIAQLTEGRSGADVRTLAISYLKSSVLAKTATESKIGLLRLAAGSTGIGTREEMARPDAQLAAALHQQLPELSFGDLGSLFNRDRKTIGRWLSPAEESRV